MLSKTLKQNRVYENAFYSTAGIYEVPDELKDKVVSAVISPSSTETRGASLRGAGAGGARALDPAADTGRDTAALVREDPAC